ncbi:YheC/YheD family protein [Microbacteriaceae bacterium 4G12]
MFSPLTVRIVCEPSIHTKNDIRIARQLAAQWNLQQSDTLLIFFGLITISVNITSIDEDENLILCSQELLADLRLPTGYLLHCNYLSSHKQLILGPIIAIMTEIKENSASLFGTLSSFCEELAQLSAQKGCFLYITSLSLWKGTAIQGYKYENGQWHKDNMPFPNIVHNRIHSRRTEQTEAFQQWLQLLKNYHIPSFNNRFLNKWEVHETLDTYVDLQPYLPRSLLLTKKKVLEQALSDYGCIFLKPVYGSQGKRIFKIAHIDNQYFLDYTTFEENIHQTYSSVRELFSTLKPYIKQPYIVQQAIDLYTYEERPVDFRILCHKTEQNIWKATSSVARVSAKEQFVSNIAMGGEMHKPMDVLLSTFDKKLAQRIHKRINALAVETATCISQSYDGLYGELGIDIGLDKAGNPWIIEINSKPSKNMISSKSKIRPSAHSILNYCCLSARQPYKEVNSS